ncbi:phosphotransferase family protein [Nesterenkonia sp. CF4.4]|uniref:phosphotransferase family protein n=1 Tax=Nesterenkonia sp. CF4.4 TaxID=3373079 RepID=UPI003EE742A0
MSQPHPEWTDADELAAQSVELPGARTLLDSSELSTLLGQQVGISRVRIKPGHSVVAAFTTADGEHGWAMLTRDEDKLTKARHRAADSAVEGEIPFLQHAEDQLFLFSGSIWADPVLAKDLREARLAIDRRAGTDQSWEILRHNPRRRVVAAVPPMAGGHGAKIVRIASRSTTRISLETAQRWRDLGLPLVRSRPLGDRGTAVGAPLWGWADLSSHPHGPAAATAGAALGTLHQITLGADRNPLPVRAGSGAAAIALVAPWLGHRARRLAQRIDERFSPLGPGVTAEVHGDLSPDQVVLATPGSHKIRLIDFDRAGTGDPMRDLGSWAAACRRLKLDSLIDDFQTGYMSRSTADLARASIWEAYAQLSTAPDAFRLRKPGWPELMQRTLTLGEEALDR